MARIDTYGSKPGGLDGSEIFIFASTIETYNCTLDEIKEYMEDNIDISVLINSTGAGGTIDPGDSFIVTNAAAPHAAKTLIWSVIRSAVSSFIQQSVVFFTTFITVIESKFRIRGQSSGYTIIASNVSSTTNYTATLPAKNFTFAGLDDVPTQLEKDTWNSTNEFFQDEEINGFIDPDNEVTCTFDNGTRTLSIQPVTTEFNFYDNSTKYTKTTLETFQISNTEGQHFIYYNGGVLTESLTFDAHLITRYAFVASIYWDVTNQKQLYFGREYKHSIKMSGDTHRRLHSTIGFALEDGGLLTNIIADGNGSSDTHIQSGVEQTICWDEDARFILSSRAITDNLPKFYRSGADASNIWRLSETASYLVIPTGTGRAAYNRLNTGTWSLTEVSNLNFLIVFITATNDTDRKFVGFIGQNEYTSLANARDAINSELGNLVTIGLPIAEFRFLGALIIQTADGYSNTVKSRVRSLATGEDYLDLRELIAEKGANSITSTDHDLLTHRDWVLGKHTGTANQLAAFNSSGEATYFDPATKADVVETIGYTTTATAGGTTTLTVSSTRVQYFTGTSNQTITMPDVTTLKLGRSYEFINLSTGTLTINSSGSNIITTVGPGRKVELVCIALTGTTAASWNAKLQSETFSFACSDEVTAITTGTGKVSGHWPFNFVATSCFIGITTTSSSGNVTLDFNDKDGNTVYSTRPTILQGEYTSLTNGTQPALITTSFTKGDKWSVDFDLAGTGAIALKFYWIGFKY
jgi:hypothetical protein